MHRSGGRRRVWFRSVFLKTLRDCRLGHSRLGHRHGSPGSADIQSSRPAAGRLVSDPRRDDGDRAEPGGAAVRRACRRARARRLRHVAVVDAPADAGDLGAPHRDTHAARRGGNRRARRDPVHAPIEDACGRREARGRCHGASGHRSPHRSARARGRRAAGDRARRRSGAPLRCERVAVRDGVRRRSRSWSRSSRANAVRRLASPACCLGSRSFSPARAASSRVASGWDASRRSTTSS